MTAAFTFTRNTVDDFVVILLGKRITGIVFLDEPVVLTSRNAVGAIQSLQVPEMNLTEFLKCYRLIPSAGIAVQQMKYESATQPGTKLTAALIAFDRQLNAHLRNSPL